MRVKSDQPLIKVRVRLARAGSIAGLLILFSGLLLFLIPQGYLWSFLVVILGFIMGSIGNRQMNRWTVEPRADQALSRALRKLDDRHHLYNYLLPVEHLLLTPYGLFVLKVKRTDGHIRCIDDRWSRNFSLLRLLRGFAPEPLGNPTREVRREMERLRSYLSSRLPGQEVKVQGVIVFTEPEVKLEVKRASLPVLPLKSLRPYLRKAAQGGEMAEEIRKELVKIFDEETA